MLQYKEVGSYVSKFQPLST